MWRALPLSPPTLQKRLKAFKEAEDKLKASLSQERQTRAVAESELRDALDSVNLAGKSAEEVMKARIELSNAKVGGSGCSGGRQRQRQRQRYLLRSTS